MAAHRSSMRLGAFLGAGLLVALALAFFVSPHASSKPDGLQKVAVDKGLSSSGRTRTLDRSPATGYAVQGVDDAGLSTGLAGLIGVGATFALGSGGFWLMRRSSRKQTGPDAPSPGT